MAAAEERHRLEVSERQLALVQSFIPRVDSKVAAMFAIASGQLAIAALNLIPTDLTKWFISVPLVFFIFMMIAVYVNLYRCAFPHLEGGHNSLVYFAEIAKLREAEFIQKYMNVSVVDLTNDICGQIWRNSEIASKKFGYLRDATKLTMWSVVPWAIILLGTSLSSGRIPLFSK